MKKTFQVVSLAGLVAAGLLAQNAPQTPGRPRGGRILLPSGQSLQPAGGQVELDTLPMAIVLTANKRQLLILHGGYHPPMLASYDAATMKQISTVRFADAWLGLAVHPKGGTVYVSGASSHVVHELTISDDGILARSRDMGTVDPGTGKGSDFFGDVALSLDGRLLYVADIYNDAVHVINPQSGRTIENWKTGRRPYRILFHPDGKSFFTSSWADGVVTQHDAQSGAVVNRIVAGPHATDMVWREKKTSDEEGPSTQFKGRIFVTLGNTNAVRVLGVSDSREMQPLESISVALYPNSPAGMTPSALALSPDQDTLYVVCSDANAVAVADIAGARGRVSGFIPTGWYPTAAAALDSDKLVVLNGRSTRGFGGSASVIQGLDPANLLSWSDQVRRNTPYTEEKRHIGHREDSTVIPSLPTERSPIEHVVYILKENRSFDEILGDDTRGQGNPARALFGRAITPNHHKIADEFILLNNFHVNGDVNADGHNWATAGIASDYVQRLWPNSHAGRRRIYDYEGGEPAAAPPAGYIWNNALAKGLRVRNYGYFSANRPLQPAGIGNHIGKVFDPALAPHTNLDFRAFDTKYPDVDRARVFLQDLARMEGEKRFPHLTLVRLSNDRSAAGEHPSPALVADNDAALGMMVEGLSRSSFWPKMAIFVVETSAGMESHRAPALVVSPYVKRGSVDSTFYNSTSVLRTMELILGLSPMTMHDAGAQPMLPVFTPTANLQPYSAEKSDGSRFGK